MLRDIIFVECGLVNNRYNWFIILGVIVDWLIVFRVRVVGVNDVYKVYKEY